MSRVKDTTSPQVPPPPPVLDLERIRDDLTALKTAVHLQASLLHDLEKILDLEIEISLP